MSHQPELNREDSFIIRFSATNLRGVLLPFPTPFAISGEFDKHALRQNVEKWNATGITGYVGLGSTGERVNLLEREYLELIEAMRAATPRQMPFIIGSGQQGTQATIDEVRHVAEAGADAVLVVTPHFYRAEMTQDSFVNHYRAVADASPVPVLLYNASPFTNISLAPETIARLSEHENIIGVKDSSGDILSLAETVRLVPDDFAVLTGSGSALYPALCVAASGGILAVGCIAPRLAVAIYEAFKAGEHTRAREMQRTLTFLTRRINGRYGISGLKAALDMLGYSGGLVRAPLPHVNDEARREIAKVLTESGLLTVEAGDDSNRLQAGASIK